MASLDALLAAHADSLSLLDDGRVKDTHTGHTMKPDAVAAYVSGARFQRRAAEAAALSSLLSTLDPPDLLSPSRNFPGRLFCSLTCHLVNAKPAAVAAHLAGKKLAAARAAAAAGELAPMAEPDLLPTDEEEEEEGGGRGGGGEGAGPSGSEGEAAVAPAAGKRGKGKEAPSPAPATPAQEAMDGDGDGGGGGAKRRAGRPSRPKRRKA